MKINMFLCSLFWLCYATQLNPMSSISGLVLSHSLLITENFTYKRVVLQHQYVTV